MACTVSVTNGSLEQQEIQAYIDRAAKKYGVEPRHIDINVCGDEVELDYDLGARPFHRIRRITGYLVGTLDRFNNAKRAEERDRVKHSLN
ncbi:MAG: anaerobic ribonucleoside-triphosphate reductase [Eubacteriales bacterium]|nr:anaerobic ribonucleoside-triphosphate reductase [Eubacteriales bacterium]